MTHTPTEWLSDETGHEVYETARMIVIATLPLSVNDKQRQERKKNAQLIAAAPELLAACRALSVCFGAGLQSGLFTQAMIDAARAAIAKATITQ